jgi:hypothetical protein
VGETSTGAGDKVEIKVKVQGPRWLGCDRVDVYGNGALVKSIPVAASSQAVTKLDLTFALARPKQDEWLVAIASGPGPGDDALYWSQSRPYQPTLAHWEPRVIGATNPIRIDGDGDGKYSSPRDYAAKMVEENKSDLKKLFGLLEDYDPAVIIQAVAILRQRGTDLDSAPIRQALDAAAPAVTQAFKAYQIILKREKE